MNATRIIFSPDQVARFWAKVDVAQQDECWLWKGAMQTGKWPYGRLTVAGRWFSAHTFSWELAHGPRPEGAVVRHKCDNPPCVNPSHLVVGSFADNTRDMHERGRRGYTGIPAERNHASKLTSEAVRNIRRDRESGMSWTALGEKYNVNRSTARRAALGLNWKTVRNTHA